MILAKELIRKYFSEKAAEASFSEYKQGDKVVPYKIEKTFKGSELEGVNYEQLMPYAKPEGGDAFRVIIGDFVTLEDGTGIVHIAPSFGEVLRDVCGGRPTGNAFFLSRAGLSAHPAASDSRLVPASGRPSGDKPRATSS